MIAHVLVVEDDFETAVSIINKLSDSGIHVYSQPCISAEQAISKVKKIYLNNEPLDAVLMDIDLAGKLDGIDASAIIKGRYKIPVIFLSAYIDKSIDLLVSDSFSHPEDLFHKSSIALSNADFEPIINAIYRAINRKHIEESIYTSGMSKIGFLPVETLDDYLKRKKLNLDRVSSELTIFVLKFKLENNSVIDFKLAAKRVHDLFVDCKLLVKRDDEGHIYFLDNDRLVFLSPHADEEKKIQFVEKALAQRIESPIQNKPIILDYVKHARFPADGDNIYEILNYIELLAGEVIPAFHRGEFDVYFQQKISCKTNKIIGFEALARWVTPDGKVVKSPVDFIPIIENTKFIHVFGLWVFEQAVKFISSAKNKVKVSINFSMKQIRKNLVSDLGNIIKRYNVHPYNVEIELTETSGIVESQENLEVLNEIKKKGISISVDDFGMENSSLTRIKNLLSVISIVKFDKSFLADFDGKSKREREFIDVLISAIYEMDLDVVFEGVETNDQRRFLEAGRCTALQGFLFGKPLHANQALELIDLD